MKIESKVCYMYDRTRTILPLGIVMTLKAYNTTNVELTDKIYYYMGSICPKNWGLTP